MIKTVFTSLLLLATALYSYPASPQQSDSVAVSFFHPGDNFLQLLMRYQGTDALSVKLASDKPCKFHLEMVKSDNGTITRKPFDVYPTKLSADTTVINFIATTYKNDSIKIGTNFAWEIIEAYPSALLIEALPLQTYTQSDTIPLIVYSHGKKQQFNFNGKEVTGFDICSVRFSKKHPSEWGKAFGIDKYLWFELIPNVKKE